MSHWEPHVPTDRKPFTVQDIFTASGTGGTLITGVTGIRIHVCHIQLSLTTTTANAITIRDDSGTPVPIAVLPASSTLGPHEWYFGPDGVACTISEGLEYTMTAGNAGALVIHGYTTRPGPVTEAASKSTW